MKLSDVQVLNPNATLPSDSADWYVLQKLINDADYNNYKRLNFPTGTFVISRTLDFTKRLNNCVIESAGCSIKPSSNFSGTMLKLSNGGDNSKSVQVTIKDLKVMGDFRSSVGIDINLAQQWSLQNVKISDCFVGLNLTDTWYGEITGESMIIQCLTGVKTNTGTQNEVNTIDFRNLDLRGVTIVSDKTRFIPKNTGEVTQII